MIIAGLGTCRVHPHIREGGTSDRAQGKARYPCPSPEMLQPYQRENTPPPGNLYQQNPKTPTFQETLSILIKQHLDILCCGERPMPLYGINRHILGSDKAPYPEVSSPLGTWRPCATVRQSR
jgi:hypothetical protein